MWNGQAPRKPNPQTERTIHGDNQPDPHDHHGNIVKNLEPKRTAGGKTVVAFRVAQTSVTERNGRWEDGETTFIRCVAYGALADHMISSGIRKGTRSSSPDDSCNATGRPRQGRSAAASNSTPTTSVPPSAMRRSRSPKPMNPLPRHRHPNRSRPNLLNQPKRRKTIHGPTCPGPFRRTTGTGFLKKKNSRAHDIRPIVMARTVSRKEDRSR